MARQEPTSGFIPTPNVISTSCASCPVQSRPLVTYFDADSTVSASRVLRRRLQTRPGAVWWQVRRRRAPTKARVRYRQWFAPVYSADEVETDGSTLGTLYAVSNQTSIQDSLPILSPIGLLLSQEHRRPALPSERSTIRRRKCDVRPCSWRQESLTLSDCF